MITDTQFPLAINDFVFNSNTFTAKSKEYSYSSIESLRFVTQNFTINFSKDECCNLSIRMTDDTIFDLQVNDALFSINRKKVAEKKSRMKIVYAYLNEMTYSRRLETYLNQLKHDCILYKFSDGTNKVTTVKIYNNGNVVIGNKIMNLKTANAAGTLKFGTAYGIGCDRTIDPYEISINEKKAMLGGRIEGFGSMRIDGSWDYPMIFEILKALS